MSEIMAIAGAVYMRDTIIDGQQCADRAFCARVGAPFGGEGPIVTEIKKTRDGHGIADFYDRLTVWAGEDILFECPAWVAEITYQHDQQATPYQFPF